MLPLQNNGDVPKPQSTVNRLLGTRIGQKALYLLRLLAFQASDGLLMTRRSAFGATMGLSLLIFPLQAGVTLADFEPILPRGSTTTVTAQSTAKIAPRAVSDVKERRETWMTAYSSTPEETDDTPFITASGKHVRDGIVATNYLPMGTKVRIPEYFGDKVFVVEDRMHPRKKDYMDIWMPTKQDALRFGIVRTEIEVLN